MTLIALLILVFALAAVLGLLIYGRLWIRAWRRRSRTTLTVAGADWSTDAWNGYLVVITDQSGATHQALVKGNTGAVLYLADEWMSPPAGYVEEARS